MMFYVGTCLFHPGRKIQCDPMLYHELCHAVVNRSDVMVG